MIDQRYIRLLESLFLFQTTGVLATEMNHLPYANLVAFSYSLDYKFIYFVTQRGTRKYENITANRNVAILIDSRKNDSLDFHASLAVTGIGTACELSGEPLASRIKLHRERLPGLDEFIRSPSIVIFQIEIERYIIVNGLTDTTTVYP
jgi:nitroimidazol reductase NimA-like FMN-containing flavoprotein (pyridoxamine 5'-phosphate oxidase superfamily)